MKTVLAPRPEPMHTEKFVKWAQYLTDVAGVTIEKLGDFWFWMHPHGDVNIWQGPFPTKADAAVDAVTWDREPRGLQPVKEAA
jgi:hypothetical protein